MQETVDLIPPESEIEQEFLKIFGARVHNLKDLDISIPRNKFVVITGISGSGKSSLAFDTIYAEGQRRYLESFSAYARQFVGGMERPDVDKISGLSPVISIEQKSTSKNPRSTVGTVTEIYDFLRLLYARTAEAYSYVTGKKMVRFTEDQIIDNLFEKYEHEGIQILAPLVKGRKGHYRELFEQARKQGYLKVRIDGDIRELEPKMQLDRYKIHDIELVVDRLKVKEDVVDRLRKSTTTAMKLGNGLMMVMDIEGGNTFQFSKHLMCPDSGISYDEPSPNNFSFNSPYGACSKCKGLGFVNQIQIDSLIPDLNKSINQGGVAPLGERRENQLFGELQKISRKYGFSLSDPVAKIPERALNYILFGDEKVENLEEFELLQDTEDRWYTLGDGGVVGMLNRCFQSSSSDSIRKWAEEFMEKVSCDACDGYRLRKESLHFKIDDKHIGQVSQMNMRNVTSWIESLPSKLSERQLTIGKEVLKEIKDRIGFLNGVGLDYLSLDRPARSLSGGESQRIRLATQIGSQLTGITYILDEPSIGLHQRDNLRLIQALKKLRDTGNTVIVVEHDRDIMLHSDHVIDLGPGAGKHGGQLVGEGSPEEFIKSKTLTALYLNHDKEIPLPEKRRKGSEKSLKLTHASGNNLKDVSVEFPLATFICVTGVSGSGKSTLVNDTLYPILHRHFYKTRKKPLPYGEIDGMKNLDKVIEIDQSPIGRTPRSNPVTYIKVFDEIRKLFAQLPESKIRGYKPGRFSFNVKSGRCDVCQGGGMKLIEMNFLPNVYVQCEKCLGKRYNRETLEIRYKGKSISDVLDMTVEEGAAFFEKVPKIYRKLKTLKEVGLDYITLGQSSTTLSGGEAQRVKLSAELSKVDTGNTFYILDEPTTGLHFEDIRMLLTVLNKLVERGNTVLVIEHNMDVIKVADYIIDLGPEGGDGGGRIIASGTPEQVAMNQESYTGQFLKEEGLDS